MPKPPQTEEGWYALHDLRRVDWDAWAAADEATRERAIEEGIDYLQAHADLDDAEEGATALFTVMGHKADFMVFHLRPTTGHLDTAERRFEGTALARFTEQVSSYVSVTEASGYTERAREYFEEREAADEDVPQSGIGRYIESRIKPTLPDAEHVCFYPMSKRRGPDHNWYDLPFDQRSDLMAAHGDIGREYAGKVSQIISGSTGLDDWEWGVTLFADDPTEIKKLLTEMRFDPSSSRYAEFGPFYFGRRFPPADLGAFLAGEPVPTGDEGTAGDPDLLAELDRLGIDAPADAGEGLVLHSDAPAGDLAEEVEGLRGNFEHYDSHVLTVVHEDGDGSAVVSLWTTEHAANTARGFLEELPGVTGVVQGALGEGTADSAESDDGDGDDEEEEDDLDAGIRQELTDLDIYAGKPHGEDVYAMVLYSEADLDELTAEVDSLRDGFDRYDTHVKTAVYEGTHTDRAAVVSIWRTQSAADTAGSFLGDLPDIVGRAGEESGFGTMGMFYTVKPEHQQDFVETFDEVGGALAGMDGHLETDLMVNVADENDMFIASQWRSREDAMGFFRSDAFRDTVQWGRDVLADRPRHVFLA